MDSEIKDLLVKQTMHCQLWQTTGNNVYKLSQCIFVILQYFSMFSIYSPKILAQLLSYTNSNSYFTQKSKLHTTFKLQFQVPGGLSISFLDKIKGPPFYSD